MTLFVEGERRLWNGGLLASVVYLAAYTDYDYGRHSELPEYLPGGGPSNYARVAIYPDYWNSGEYVQNRVGINFAAPPPGSTWPEVVAFALHDSASGGNLLVGAGADNPPLVATHDDPLIFHVGGLHLKHGDGRQPPRYKPRGARVRSTTLPPTPITRSLPDPVRIDRPNDGSAVTWQWPASWSDAGVVAALVQIYGAGGGGTSSRYGPAANQENTGQAGEDSSVTQGAVVWTAEGGSGGHYTGARRVNGAGATGGRSGPAIGWGAGHSGGNGELVAKIAVPGNGPLRIMCGRGGAGGNHPRVPNGQRGQDGWVIIGPLR